MLRSIVRSLEPGDMQSVLLPLGAFVLWLFSLQAVDVRQMNDLGLISVLPAANIIALVILSTSFCLLLQRSSWRVPLIILHVGLLIMMLYGVTALVEEVPRFSIVYRHNGYTEFIMRTGTVNPYLDAYFSWPGFFVLSALVTRVAGYHDILSFAAWAPVFYNLLYLAPMYMIFTSATTDKRLVWLAVWFFYLSNWIGQDYFSPQGLDFFLYLVIVAILVTWFKTAPSARFQRQELASGGRLRRFSRSILLWLTAPDAPGPPTTRRQRLALIACVLVIFAFVVYSHPLTPFLVIATVTALVVFRRCSLWWLPIVMAVMALSWLYFMAQVFISGHSATIFAGFGQIGSNLGDSVTSHVVGDPEHTFIVQLRILMTLLLWGLALFGGIRRLLEGHRDVTYVLLALAPFPLIIVQSYGGEAFLRIYLFALPLMAFFTAALFYPLSSEGRSHWVSVGLVTMSLILLAGFLFTRYGNERIDYKTNQELAGLHYLYKIAAPGSLLVQAWDSGAWEFQGFGVYDYTTLSDTPVLANAVGKIDVNTVTQYIEQSKRK
ncbi:MAG TPA: hypothetical protein VFU49_24930, partial [Ktedonobacteraceae bacterium]|nr:hypothetical protein [Ktedonobacteraceae bacterium]